MTTNKTSFSKSLEERKAAYLVARERIFSMKLEEVKEPGEQKPRSVPVVARRMIAHALGQRIHTKNQNGLASDSINDGSLKDELNVQDKNGEVSNLTKDSEEILCLRRNPNRLRNSSSSNASSHNKRNDQKPVHEELPLFSQDTTQGQTVNKDYMKKEHLGAAKRMFAHALGVQSGKGGSVPRNRSGEIKKN
ncbi:hypothetical protein V8G54_029033 [Vigna mungo]|uniref:SUZ domain-containing protein n=1 Tax=Vigna mungo TaxID=3915 RepID=A0AAQ3RL21_VIGMU